VSAAYHKSITPPGSYIVQVQQTGNSQPLCQEIYSQQGALIQTVH
jgi:hypothetical protein